MTIAAPAEAALPQLVHQLPEYARAEQLAIGEDGAAWFSGNSGGARGMAVSHFIDRLGPGGELTEFPLAAGEYTGTPVMAPGGEVLFPLFHEHERGKAPFEVASFSASGRGRTYLVKNIFRIDSMTVLNGELWFSGVTRMGSALRSTIGRIAISADGSTKLNPLPRGCQAGEIAASAGGIWFGEKCEGHSNVVHMTRGSHFSRRPVSEGDFPSYVAVGPERTVWFGVTRHGGSKRARAIRISPTGKLREFEVPGAEFFSSIAVGPKHRLWFRSGLGARTLGSIGPRGHVRKRICIGQGCELTPASMTIGPEGDIWFTANPSYLLPSEGGGGAFLLEEEARERDPGSIWRLQP